MQKYLITGAMGFIGSHLCERLLDEGKQVWGIDIAEPHYENELKSRENFNFIKETIKNTQVLRKLVSKVDCVCHLAALPNPRLYLDEPRKIMDVTLQMSLDLIEICNLRDVLFFYTSTSEIYGRNPDVPWAEDSDRVLGSTDVNRWCYSTSKAGVEHYLKSVQQQNNLDYITVRPFNFYGPRLRGRVVYKFIRNAIQQEPITIHGDGKQTRCFTYVDDAIDAFYKLLETPETQNRVYNIGHTEETSIEQLANMIKEISDHNTDIEYQSYENAYDESYEDIPRRVPDISRVQDTIGWKPETTLYEGVQKEYKYLKDQYQDND
jgi:UDP-glucose 4-epimerase